MMNEWVKIFDDHFRAEEKMNQGFENGYELVEFQMLGNHNGSNYSTYYRYFVHMKEKVAPDCGSADRHFEEKCTCHERDSSQTCPKCHKEGVFGHSEESLAKIWQEENPDKEVFIC